MAATAAKIAELNTERAPNRVRSEWKIVDVAQATRWLEGNVHNRTVRDTVVQRYASDMKAGRWRQTHQGLAFDEHGVLIDGQHRLFAVIEAETSVLFQVTYGLPMETQMVIDDGLGRTVTDVMKLADEAMSGITALHTASANRMRKGLSADWEKHRETKQQQAIFLKRHWEAICFACNIPGGRRIKGVTNAGTIAAVARAYYHEDRAMLSRFLQVLAEGLTTDAKDYAAMKLRNWLVGQAPGRGARQIEAYAKTERAIEAFCQRKDVGRNLMGVTEELYPLPEGRVR